MKLAVPEQMSAMDAYSINELGIPGIVLMENAALKVVEEAEKLLGSLRGKTILLLAGKGNNGGDAFAAARHLFSKGARIRVYLAAKSDDVQGDAAVNLAIIRRMGVRLVELSDSTLLQALEEELEKVDLIIDGIFGTGFKGEIRGIIGDVAERVNSASRSVLAIDIPSGVHGETGKVEGICIKATRTVTFGLPKVGLVVHPGCEFTGELVVADIGIPAEAVARQDIRFNVLDAPLVSSMLPVRQANSNKGDYGRVMLISGSTGMTGSGCLCSKAALRSGAGLVYLGVPASLSPIYSAALQEQIVIPLEDEGTGRLTGKCTGTLLKKLSNMDAAAIGPGISTAGETAEVVQAVVENAAIPLVLDADALNLIAGNLELLKKVKTQAVITPHPGEMSRLTGRSIQDIQADRCRTALDFAARWGTVVVLKGSRTVVALPDGRAYINTCGNPGMATAGTGDILTGIIAGLIAQGLTPADAAAAGVYLHARAGDAAAARMGMPGMVAGDLLEALPHTLNTL